MCRGRHVTVTFTLVETECLNCRLKMPEIYASIKAISRTETCEVFTASKAETTPAKICLIATGTAGMKARASF